MHQTLTQTQVPQYVFLSPQIPKTTKHEKMKQKKMCANQNFDKASDDNVKCLICG
jgi:hypothetical protein